MDKKTIDLVREYYKLPEDVTDEQIKKDLKGSLGEAYVNIDIATQKLKMAFIQSIPKIFKKYFNN